ncbi:glucosaminidase domain-containing protein [Cohnella zeiphila]|uniref:Glucosaminidase domain-containing protein n=1 Tax=Cohnella zeiphila TaxID=2761120 RepID=A0A7X0SHZ2_9BACL|nr:glucosaminidase domain-containing protein [Cohnella zeiphila]MBB6730318.1 glucosaminidase domain-containing protein [Cohnella zeiphila]
MGQTALLSPSDVLVIRRYVQTKFAPLPGAKQAEIVADAVRGALERRLPELPSDVKARVAGELIRRCLIREQREVGEGDVVDACADAGLGADIDPEPLARWLQQRAGGRWSREQLDSRLDRAGRRSLLPAVVPSPAEALPPAVMDGGAALPLAAIDAAPADAGAAKGFAAALGRRAAWMLLAATLAAGAGLALLPQAERQEAAVPGPAGRAPHSVPAAAEPDGPGMPQALRYADFDEAAVKTYLRGRDSMLANEPYFGAIVASARKYDVHPLLLFAIAGQEQGFVPKSKKEALRIANNPFNVFHSWQEYNTDIADTSEIAAKLIAKLGKSRPKGVEPFAWFNRTYAEDPAWSDGVRKLFDMLVSLPETTSK